MTCLIRSSNFRCLHYIFRFSGTHPVLLKRHEKSLKFDHNSLRDSDWLCKAFRFWLWCVLTNSEGDKKGIQESRNLLSFIVYRLVIEATSSFTFWTRNSATANAIGATDYGAADHGATDRAKDAREIRWPGGRQRNQHGPMDRQHETTAATAQVVFKPRLPLGIFVSDVQAGRVSGVLDGQAKEQGLEAWGGTGGTSSRCGDDSGCRCWMMLVCYDMSWCLKHNETTGVDFVRRHETQTNHQSLGTSWWYLLMVSHTATWQARSFLAAADDVSVSLRVSAPRWGSIGGQETRQHSLQCQQLRNLDKISKVNSGFQNLTRLWQEIARARGFGVQKQSLSDGLPHVSRTSRSDTFATSFLKALNYVRQT